MKKWTLFVLVLFAACSANAQAQGSAKPLADTKENRIAAAKRYLKAVPPDEMLANTVELVAAQLPADRREEFKSALRKVLKSEHIEEITLNAVVRHFTVREINALSAFYSSPEGRSITRKFGAYMSDVMPALQEELEEAVKVIEQEVH